MLRSVRLGFATNSSSSHSVVLHSRSEGLASLNTPIDTLADGEEEYTLTKARDKFLALACVNAGRIERASAHERMQLARVMRELGIEQDTREVARRDLPISAPSDMIAPETVPLPLWVRFMLDPRVAAYGYNDNDDFSTNPIDDPSPSTLNDLGGNVWKVDGDALVSFCRFSGTKLRWSEQPYEKASTPELVDVKITDFCGYGCKFCYQGSTKAGTHAPLERIERIFDELAAMQVFEVAIGGGEPAHHPEFDRIVRAADERGLTLNFTAYGTDWARNKSLVTALFGLDERNVPYRRRGIGISVHSARDLVKFDRIEQNLSSLGVDRWRLNLIGQTVVGATPMTVTNQLADACMQQNRSLLLLGYKPTGRGKDYRARLPKPKAIRDLVLRAREHIERDYGSFHLSVDTAFLDLYGEVLDEVGIPQVLRTSPEGKFSMYVDAVENRCGPSSYCDQSLMDPIESLREQFAAY